MHDDNLIIFQAAVDKATDNLKEVNKFLKDGRDLLMDARELLDMAQANIFVSLCIIVIYKR